MQATGDDIGQLCLEFPDVPDVDHAVLLAKGDNASCYLAEKSGLVLRVPKADEIKARTRAELVLLQFLGTALGGIDAPLVPDIRHRSQHSMAHAYPYIPGTVLTRGWFQETTFPQQVQLAHSLAAFLSRLHAVELPCDVASVLPQYDSFDGTNVMVDLVAGSHLSHLLDDVRSAVAVCSWFDRHDDRVLLHNDFTHGNLILEKKESLTGRRYALAGVIDWTNAYVGPAYRELRQLALVAPHFVRMIVHPKRVPGVAAAAFLRGVRLALCEPGSVRHSDEMYRALREHRVFNRYTIHLDEASDALAQYAGAGGPTEDLALASAFDRASQAEKAIVDMTTGGRGRPGATPRVGAPLVPYDELPTAWRAQYPAMEGDLRC
ncbi:phosphotransferase family protein [Duganella vulcania]|uniref:Phosphotransferase n=1 Tax=Duganella vulcania TaxID=2692166 RepID=A0A845GFM1_9BURK|nr:aminoglycoside phosphotransferase family protein [Duganella vulcania]MYM92300.1 phosphotransferase [Duganella vulcania]